MNCIEHEEVIDTQGLLRLTSEPFEEGEEARITDLALQRHRDLVRIALREVRRELALPYRGREHPIGPLARPLDQTTPRERIGEAPIAGSLAN